MQGGEEALQRELDDSLEDAAVLRAELEATQREAAHKDKVFQETLDSMQDRLDQFQEVCPAPPAHHHHLNIVSPLMPHFLPQPVHCCIVPATVIFFRPAVGVVTSIRLEKLELQPLKC